MFKELKKYKKIIIVGPQRSGTRICTHIISQETGHKYIDEEDYGISDRQLFEKILNTNDKIVVQSPSMTYCIEKYTDNNTIIIIMYRDIKNIITSQKRIKWTKADEDTERENYKKHWGTDDPKIPISIIKYKIWERQKKGIKQFKEVDYESLCYSDLWVNKENRGKAFKKGNWKQWRIN